MSGKEEEIKRLSPREVALRSIASSPRTMTRLGHQQRPPVTPQPPRPDDSVSASEQLDQIAEVLGLSDAQVSEAFPDDVGTETVASWRQGNDPEEGDLYRLGLLYKLAFSISNADIDGPAWLHRPSQEDGLTPFRRICDGHLSEVQTAVNAVSAGLSDAGAPMEGLGVLCSADEPVEAKDDGEWVSGDDR